MKNHVKAARRACIIGKIGVLLLLVAGTRAWAFDWPQSDVDFDSFSSQFGQLRGDQVSSSLVFSSDASVRAADKGRVIALIIEHEDEFGWFESALGSAVILSHTDGLDTVYANLETSSVSVNLTDVKQGDSLGKTGNTGWQDGKSALEFKVFDAKNKSAINPSILMPRVARETSPDIGTVMLEDKKAVSHNLLVERRLPAGSYAVYKTRQEGFCPFKTQVAVNGITYETVSYDVLKENYGKLGIYGNIHYTTQDIYPDAERQLVGTVEMSRGANTLSVTVQGMSGSSTTLSYQIDVY